MHIGTQRADLLAYRELGPDALDCRVTERALFLLDGPNWRRVIEGGLSDRDEELIKSIEERWAEQ